MTDTITASLANLDEVLAAPLEPTGAPDESVDATEYGLDAGAARDLFADMVLSRLLDEAARTLKARDLGWYTISSAGHEHMAVVGAHLARTDPCFLHYRDGALVIAKSRRHPDPDHDVVAATVASFVAAADDPASGGRHKVWGDPATWIIPQTSTIGSHPPKAVGTAAMLARATRLTHPVDLPGDAIVVCSVGDASSNHASTLSALTAARWAHRHGNPVPLLFVVEDNGRGISVPTPPRWVADSLSHLPGLAFHDAVGPVDHVWATVAAAVAQVRAQRRPVVLRLPTVRLGGHAGSDVESGYRARADIVADLARDPLPLAARRFHELGLVTVPELREIVAEARTRVDAAVAAATDHPPLRTAQDVVRPLAPHHPDIVVADAHEVTARAARGPHQQPNGLLTLAQALNAALAEQLDGRPEAIVFGEDVGHKGGVYGITKGLQGTHGRARVFDTLLDETTILGTAQGAGLVGLLPFPEIQYLAYVHNALDQLRGEAASTSFFSDGAFTTPMVVRIAGLAYQRGFGGHFHDDNSIGALRDIPGVRLAVPTRADDAVGMLRAAAAMARVDGNVVVFLEPIALYHERDLHEPGDQGWLGTWPTHDHVLLPGELGIHDEHGHGAEDAVRLAIVTWGNGVRMSRQVAAELARDGVTTRVVDLRWLVPLPHDRVRTAIADCDAVLVVDEGRATGGGIADAIVADLARHDWSAPLASVTSMDSFIPLGPAADLVLLDRAAITTAAHDLLGRLGWHRG